MKKWFYRQLDENPARLWLWICAAAFVVCGLVDAAVAQAQPPQHWETSAVGINDAIPAGWEPFAVGPYATGAYGKYGEHSNRIWIRRRVR